MDIIDAKPTQDEVEARHWQPTYEDWVQERHNAVARADERDAYAKKVETLTKECNAAKADAATLRHAWTVCEAISQKQDEALEAAGLAMDHYREQNERLNHELEQAQQAVGEVTKLRAALASAKQQAEDWRFTADSRERVAATLRTQLDVTQADLAQARQTANKRAENTREYEHILGIWRPDSGQAVCAKDEVKQPTTLCPHSKAKEVGPSSFVVRRCKLADGHDGMCEPA